MDDGYPDRTGFDDFMDDSYDYLVREYVENNREDFIEFCREEYKSVRDDIWTKNHLLNPNNR